MYEFYIYDKSTRTRIAILQGEESVQWCENYQSPGEVKIVARATSENLAALVEGNRVYNTDSDTVAKICHVDIVETESETTITARAQITSMLFDERIIMATEQITNVEAGMYSLYSKNRRDLPIEVGTSEGYTETTEMEVTWTSVLDAIQKLADGSGIGFKIVFDPETSEETLKVFKGIDRSNDSSDDYVGYFGTDVGNIANVSVSTGISDYKNVAVVAGAGEGAARTVRIVSLGNVSGEDRRELYVDARDLQRDYQVATPTGAYDSSGNPTYTYATLTYTEAQYNAILDARGLEKLAEHLKTFSITCDIAQNNIRYGTDYFLGDRMPIKLPEYGIYATARISSVTIVYEQSGRTIVALLSEFELSNE